MKTSDKFDYDHIAKFSDAVSIISKYMGRSVCTGMPSGKGKHYRPEFYVSWCCDAVNDELVMLEWNKEKIKVTIATESLYIARYEEKKPISQKAHDAIEAKLYQLAGELTAAGFYVAFY